VVKSDFFTALCIFQARAHDAVDQGHRRLAQLIEAIPDHDIIQPDLSVYEN
jgi:hypothetical protein